MEILNYTEQPPGKATIGIFDLYLPALQMTLRKFRLIRTKKGGLIVSSPSYSEEKEFGQKEWFPYVEFSEEKKREFNQKCLEALKPFIR